MQKFKDDHDALLQLAEGNLDAYRFLFDHHFSDLCNFLMIYLHSKELSEDIALEIFTFIWEKRQTLQINTNFKSFLFAAAKNKAITLYKKEHQKIFTQIENVESVMPNDSYSQFTMENNELRGLINDAIFKLPDKIIIRYADVLLMYAEAKIELGEIDQTVPDAINKVRARAYKVAATQTSLYPAVTSTVKTELRKIVRTERRMEFALESVRYMDLIRWKLAAKVLNIPNYNMLDPADLRTKVVKPGLWFFPQVPEIDDDGVADFTPMYSAGLVKRGAIRNFDAAKQYLWPIPSKEILINTNLKQNSGY